MKKPFGSSVLHIFTLTVNETFCALPYLIFPGKLSHEPGCLAKFCFYSSRANVAMTQNYRTPDAEEVSKLLVVSQWTLL